MAVPTNDLAGYVSVLEKAEIREDIYTLVPLTFDKEIQDQVAGHVNAMSSPENGMWRIAALCSKAQNPKAIVDFLDDGATDVTADSDGQR
jgi:hypothetical protein